MKILVLGGTRFFGKKLVERLVAARHDVTIGTRGKTTDNFGDEVKRVVLNRESRDDLFQLAKEDWDVIYDNICFSPQEALYAVDAFKGKVKRYIFTSSLSVYSQKGHALVEEDFNPKQYEIVSGDKEDFDYGEGKRLAEAVFFQKASFPVVAVRFPIVLGMDDYTKRLHFHLEHIKNQQEIGISNNQAEIGFITSDEAARFLEWIGISTEITGPINASSNGTYSLNGFIKMLEAKIGQKALVEEVTDDEDNSPFGIEKTYYLDNSKATEAGFIFDNLHDWLPKLVTKILQEN
ncbi:SDR family oxidoreductase [Listeria immobilis]|uniref:SDR family oxidoreductase n=1 Tax=Listeria immobilis TaxID=2713502 RepID=A0ABR6SXT6_9LIST|nr:SDR family oxidoreductase [Listeria immobilis]MBC1483387.1 SDR family oxidoreductase [Listeria immobilis]MBC1507631.1 SDR family oxidoreductase [Listeria immobilis]MBC1510496.1 SDR family oxidoreductase [Listeria immobilis]MBC1516714.1 SDR family oxidoreductase [Listeria immobilis]MBC6303629.1 SDR family oxidoreductase [Listeria immobilis]